MRAWVLGAAFALEACASDPVGPPLDVVAERVMFAVPSGSGPYLVRDGSDPSLGVAGIALEHDGLSLGFMDAVPGEVGEPFVVDAGEGVLWGNAGGFTTCGQIIFAGSTSLEGLAGLQAADCHALIRDEYEGRVTYTVSTGAGADVSTYDLATGIKQKQLSLVGSALHDVTNSGTKAFAVQQSMSSSAVVSYERGAPAALTTIAVGTAPITGLSLLGDHAYWVEAGETSSVVFQTSLSSPARSALAEIPDAHAEGLTATDDALWLVATTPGDRNHSSLVRVSWSGDISSRELSYRAQRLMASGGELYVLAWVSTSEENSTILIREPIL